MQVLTPQFGFGPRVLFRCWQTSIQPVLTILFTKQLAEHHVGIHEMSELHCRAAVGPMGTQYLPFCQGNGQPRQWLAKPCLEL